MKERLFLDIQNSWTDCDKFICLDEFLHYIEKLPEDWEGWVSGLIWKTKAATIEAITKVQKKIVGNLDNNINNLLNDFPVEENLNKNIEEANRQYIDSGPCFFQNQDRSAQISFVKFITDTVKKHPNDDYISKNGYEAKIAALLFIILHIDGAAYLLNRSRLCRNYLSALNKTNLNEINAQYKTALLAKLMSFLDHVNSQYHSEVTAFENVTKRDLQVFINEINNVKHLNEKEKHSLIYTGTERLASTGIQFTIDFLLVSAGAALLSTFIPALTFTLPLGISALTVFSKHLGPLIFKGVLPDAVVGCYNTVTDKIATECAKRGIRSVCFAFDYTKGLITGPEIIIKFSPPKKTVFIEKVLASNLIEISKKQKLRSLLEPEKPKKKLEIDLAQAVSPYRM